VLDARLFTLFLVAALALLITPGPAVIYIVTRSIDQGRSAGFVSAFGVFVGTLCHVAAAALGLSALLMSSALAFQSVKYLGAAYLIYLGIRKLTSRGGAEQNGGPVPRQKLSAVFRQGVIVNVFNPKTALFFLAFLPQFVNVHKGSVALQILTLGTIFACMGFTTDSSWALLAGTMATKMKRNLAFSRLQNYFSGGVYLSLGLATAFTGSHRSQ
jgi:threonine/homoserine/homoserine lactone efflux protein